jgi:peroxiredoxin Q/BCP
MQIMQKGILIMGLLSILGFAAKAEPLAVGALAPRLATIDQDGQPIDLGALYDKGLTLVYFYPKADTPGCTAEACSLRDAFADLVKNGVQVVGVSADTPESQKKFQQKYKLPFPLVADPDLKVIDAFGVAHTFGFASRQSFLIKDGKIVWCDLHASTKQQAADVLKAAVDLK